MEGVGMDKWDKSKQDAMKRGMWKMYVQQFICSLLVAYVLAHIIWGMNTAFGRPFDAMSGLSTGFWVWLGFFLPVMYGGHLWTGKAFKYAAIDIGYWLVLLSVMGMILASWQV